MAKGLYLRLDDREANRILGELAKKLKDKGKFVTTCTGKALEYQTAIWTELQK